MAAESDQFPCNSMEVLDWKIAINTKTTLRRWTKYSLKRQTARFSRWELERDNIARLFGYSRCYVK
jgi:hypothetical protein